LAGLDDEIGLFRDLYEQHNAKSRVKIQLAPANLHWCSDNALTMLSEASKKYNVPMHMHLVETAYQKEYALRRGKCTGLEYIDRFDMVNERLPLGPDHLRALHIASAPKPLAAPVTRTRLPVKSRSRAKLMGS
jgi:cytosine/adenosine deaminase-related metal-dependent hydrolase